MFAVFENDKPAKYPECNVHKSWSNNEFDEWNDAVAYALDWLGYGNESVSNAPFEPNVPFYYSDSHFVVIKEIA